MKIAISGFISLSVFSAAAIPSFSRDTEKNIKPNVILVLTDDQGFGDLGFYGNPIIKTPVLDRLASESVRFNEFIVSPVSSPTRAGIMTGRYCSRTGVRDTYKGGAIMASTEITIAEMLRNSGYETGMIGKWHLGDNYPFRPEDQGFDFTLRHLSGGIGQPGDWPNTLKGDSSYFNPILWKNGKMFQSHGYCTDVFTSAALDFIEENKEHPFFLYIAFNAPHVPLQVPEKFYEMYKGVDPTKGFENDPKPFPIMNEKARESARRVYAMVSNIDYNMGRLLNKLKQLKLENNTLVIFMSDNGPEQNRYIAGMRGKKSSVYEGGVRVPSFWRYPALFKGGREIDVTASNNDIFPTLAEICGGKVPTDRELDGISLLPLLTGKAKNISDRSLCRYWTREYPEKFINVSIRRGVYKLVGNCNAGDGVDKFELFNMANDPYEQRNIVLDNLDKARNLRKELDRWMDEMLNSPNIKNSPRPVIGSINEATSFLNLNDAIYIKDKDSANDQVYWKVRFSDHARYDIIIHFQERIEKKCQLLLKVGKVDFEYDFEIPESDVLKIENLDIPAGDSDIFPKIFTKVTETREYLMPFYLEVKKHVNALSITE